MVSEQPLARFDLKLQNDFYDEINKKYAKLIVFYRKPYLLYLILESNFFNQFNLNSGGTIIFHPLKVFLIVHNFCGRLCF